MLERMIMLTSRKLLLYISSAKVVVKADTKRGCDCPHISGCCATISMTHAAECEVQPAGANVMTKKRPRSTKSSIHTSTQNKKVSHDVNVQDCDEEKTASLAVMID
jgi:hypothetical protein